MNAQRTDRSRRSASDSAGVRVTKPWWRDRWHVFYTVLLALLLLWVAVASTGRLGGLVEPAAVSKQMDDIKSEALRSPGGRHVVVDERVRLHGTEGESWVLVLQDRRTHDEFYAGAANGIGQPPRSDEVRIYDIEGGRLKQKLRFQPRGTGASAAEWRQVGGDAPLATDYDKDRTKEVIAGYDIPAQATSALVPFAITWEGHRYVLVPLTPKPPQLSNRKLDLATAKYRREPYAQRTFVNRSRGRGSSDLKLQGYRVQAFAVVEKPSPRLLTGYFVKFPGAPNVLELHASQFRGGGPQPRPCTPDYAACPAPESEHEVVVPPDRGLDTALTTAWEKVGQKWSREVRVVERRR